MKKIAIFGGGGFVGSRLCPVLANLYDITIIDTFWFWNNQKEYAEKTQIENVHIITGDIRNKDIKKIIKNKDVVINLACLSNDMCSDINYNFTHDISYNGVMNIINNTISCNIPKLIQTSSTSVYGVKQGKMVDETEVPEPITQYSKIKAELDNVLSYYMKYNKTGITILRPATLYGYSPRLRLDIMINTLLDRAIRERGLMIEGGEQFRPCLHVDDLCNAYIQSIENPISNNKIYNVTNENYSVNQIVEIIKSVLPNIAIHYQHVIDRRSYKTDSKLIQKELKLKFTKKLNKKTILELYNYIKDGYYNKDKTINVKVIQHILNKNGNEIRNTTK